MGKEQGRNEGKEGEVVLGMCVCVCVYGVWASTSTFWQRWIWNVNRAVIVITAPIINAI